MASAHPGRRWRSRTPVALVGVVTLTLVLAACGGGGSEKASGVASLGGNASTTTTAPKSSADTRQLWLDAAACMRKNGVDFPDPTFDANGRPQFDRSGQTGQGNGGPGSVFRNDDPKTQAARKACQSEFDKIRSSFPAPSPAEAAQRKQQILALAACMREQGIDFPDPTFDANGRPTFGQGGQGGPGGGPGGAARRDDPAFQKAMQTCRTKLGVTFGRGPGGARAGGGTSTTPTTTGNA